MSVSSRTVGCTTCKAPQQQQQQTGDGHERGCCSAAAWLADMTGMTGASMSVKPVAVAAQCLIAAFACAWLAQCACLQLLAVCVVCAHAPRPAWLPASCRPQPPAATHPLAHPAQAPQCKQSSMVTTRGATTPQSDDGSCVANSLAARRCQHAVAGCQVCVRVINHHCQLLHAAPPPPSPLRRPGTCPKGPPPGRASPVAC